MRVRLLDTNEEGVVSVMIVQIGANESYTGPDLCLPGAETCAVPPLAACIMYQLLTAGWCPSP